MGNPSSPAPSHATHTRAHALCSVWEFACTALPHLLLPYLSHFLAYGGYSGSVLASHSEVGRSSLAWARELKLFTGEVTVVVGYHGGGWVRLADVLGSIADGYRN